METSEALGVSRAAKKYQKEQLAARRTTKFAAKQTELQGLEAAHTPEGKHHKRSPQKALDMCLDSLEDA